MTPTRRGFLGSLAAIGVVAVAPFKLAAEKTKTKRTDKSPWLPCRVEFEDRYRATMKMKSKYKITITHEDDLVIRNVEIDCGTVAERFGEIWSVRIYDIPDLPQGHRMEFDYRTAATIGDSLRVSFPIETSFVSNGGGA